MAMYHALIPYEGCGGPGFTHYITDIGTKLQNHHYFHIIFDVRWGIMHKQENLLTIHNLPSTICELSFTIKLYQGSRFDHIQVFDIDSQLQYSH
mgnify:CR=1 FL=1